MLMIPLPRDFQDFLSLLNANAIRYLVIGGYAVAYHGYVRYTGDLDIFVELSTDNAGTDRPRPPRIRFRFAKTETRVVPAKGKNRPDGT